MSNKFVVSLDKNFRIDLFFLGDFAIRAWETLSNDFFLFGGEALGGCVLEVCLIGINISHLVR